MQFRGTIRFKDLLVDEYKKAFKAAVERHVRRAAREFVRAAVVNQPIRVPIQTGMSRGSYLNIAKYLRKYKLSVYVPLEGKSKTRTRKVKRKGKEYTWTEKNQWYYLSNGTKIPKTPESGAALSPFEFFVTDKRVGFKINSKVFHYTLQDVHPGFSPTAPWESMEAGRDAFMAEMRNLKKYLPKIKDYSVETTISFGAGSRGITKTRGTLRIRKVESG